MKKLFLFVVFFLSVLVNAQFLIEDNDITENVSDNGKVATLFELNNPVEYYRLKCSNPMYAQFSGGDDILKKEITKKLNLSIDQNAYYVNGTFDLIFSIDKEGNLSHFDLKPEVTNGNMLYQDLNSSFQGFKKLWKPATCDGVKVDSKIRVRVNFRTDVYDL